MLEQRGTCPVCLRNSAITKSGVIRSHLVPQALAGRHAQSRPRCEGSGQTPLAEPARDSPSVSERWTWPPETHVLAQAYNAMHRQLCPKNNFCSEHQPAYGLLDAVRRELSQGGQPAQHFVAVDVAD